MVVQHNLQAMNANRMLNVTTGQQAKSTEKLSSGYKINRAADDAAGLTISEKMRKQIRGLDQASTNAQDGVSAVQTAEGALTEVHSMLQRMNELATQASNGTNAESDRQAIQDEISQLTTEIDRVAETTKFNETYLLKGNTAGTESKVKINAHDAGLKGKLTDNGDTAVFELTKELEKGDKVTIAGKEYTIGSDASTTSTEGYDLYDNIKDKKIAVGDSVTIKDAGVEKTYTLVDKTQVAADWKDGTKFTITDEKGNTKEYTIAAATALTDNGGAIKNTDAEKLIKKELANPDHKVLSGPSHAEEVSRKIPTTCVIGAATKEYAEYLQNIFMSEVFRVYINPDILGIELGGSLKNVIALAAGIADGLGYGDNTKAALITRGIHEISKLGVAMGGRLQTFYGLSGIGDLIVTCASMHSRNRRAGILIGQGKTMDEAMKEVHMVVEGVYSAKAAYMLSKKYEVEMPIVETVNKVLFENMNAAEGVKELMHRDKKNENTDLFW